MEKLLSSISSRWSRSSMSKPVKSLSQDQGQDPKRSIDEASESNRPGLDSLPGELLVRITKNLSSHDTVRLGQLNRHLHTQVSIASDLYRLLNNDHHNPQDVLSLLHIEESIPKSFYRRGTLLKPLFYKWLCDKYGEKMERFGVNSEWVREKFTCQNLRKVLKEAYLDVSALTFCSYRGIDYQSYERLDDGTKQQIMDDKRIKVFCEYINNMDNSSADIMREVIVEKPEVSIHMIRKMNNMIFAKNDVEAVIREVLSKVDPKYYCFDRFGISYGIDFILGIVELNFSNPNSCIKTTYQFFQINGPKIVIGLMKEHGIKLHEHQAIFEILHAYNVHPRLQEVKSGLKCIGLSDIKEYYQSISECREILIENSQHIDKRRLNQMMKNIDSVICAINNEMKKSKTKSSDVSTDVETWKSYREKQRKKADVGSHGVSKY